MRGERLAGLVAEGRQQITTPTPQVEVGRPDKAMMVGLGIWAEKNGPPAAAAARGDRVNLPPGAQPVMVALEKPYGERLMLAGAGADPPTAECRDREWMGGATGPDTPERVQMELQILVRVAVAA